MIVMAYVNEMHTKSITIMELPRLPSDCGRIGRFCAT
jgi:hypothetical protein